MKKTKLDVKKILSLAQQGQSRWELDNIIWNDRSTNPKTLFNFLTRIQQLTDIAKPSKEEKVELSILLELAEELDQDECIHLLSDDDEVAQQNYVESLARQCAIEVLCNEKMSVETMNTMCKLSPSDFILTSKRTQDLINAIHELVIQGETLSKDVAGA